MQSPYHSCTSTWLIFASALIFILASQLVHAEDEEWLLTVQPGDTLMKIGYSYLQQRSDWTTLRKLNKIGNPRRLQPGSQLRIPIPLLKRQVVMAEVIRVKGDVRARLSGGDEIVLAPGSTLREADQILTGPDSNLTLSFVDGSRLLVLEQSQLTLETLRVYGKSGVTDTRLRLHKGQLDTQVNKLKGPAARYQITTPALALGVRGTSFRVATEGEGGTSRSEVMEGLVAADGSGTELNIPAGFGTLASEGKPATTAIKLLAAPDLSQSPALLQRVPLRFNWQPLEGAVGYHAQVFADANFEQLLLDGVFVQPEAKFADLPDGNYIMRVRAVDQAGLEGLNTVRSFTLKARPEPPFLSQPTQDEKRYGEQVEFQWSKASEAQSYQFQLAQNAEFNSPVITLTDPGQTGVSHKLAPGEYFWRMASIRAGNDQGPFSDTARFTLRAIPESPKLEKPKVDNKQLTFQWPAGQPGQKYQFQLASDAGFSKILVDQMVDKPEITLERPGGGVYFMHARAIDGDGFAGPYGAPQEIKVPQRIPWLVILLVLALPFAF